MKISQHIVDALYQQALEAAPIEACGYLAGIDDVVRRHFPMVNSDQSEIHFAFNPEEQFRVLKAARKANLQLIGIYHSHPKTPARPSREDILLAYDSGITHVIVSLEGGQKHIRGFKISEGHVTPDNLEII